MKQNSKKFATQYVPNADLPLVAGIGRFIPSFLKPVVQRFTTTRLYKRWRRRFFSNPISRQNVLDYWRLPDDEGNTPEAYLGRNNQGLFLLDIIKRYATPDMSFLDIGCNVGNKLNHLFNAGYRNLEGVEISEQAVQQMRVSYPEMAAQAVIHTGSVEDVLPALGDNAYDVVYTVAVLYHIHYDSDWVMREIARITGKYLITIECELATTDWRHFPRDYRKVFEQYGMKQVEEIDCSKSELVKGDFGNTFWARVFEKQEKWRE